MPSRPVYLVVYNSHLFAAHWAMWIPIHGSDTQTTGNFGKCINVRGDARNGFVHEFARNHDIDQDTTSKEIILLGWADVENVDDRARGTEPYTDIEATDKMEEWALRVPAPGPSLRPARLSPSGSRSRVELQNCQTWMADFVRVLVENELLDEGANTVIANAPKN